MNKFRVVLAGLVFMLCARPAFSNSLSFTGSLADPYSSFQVTFNLAGNSDVAIQTWSFGGGTNAAAVAISPGGFDPMVALFTGPAATASIYVMNGDAAADALKLTSANSFVGNCPPAGLVTIGLGTFCGDDLLSIPGLLAGTYTLVLTTGGNGPYAVNPGPPYSTLLSDGFNTLDAAFETCNSTDLVCSTRTSDFAVDIVSKSGLVSVPAPEPSIVALLMTSGLLTLASIYRRRRRDRSLA